MIPAIRRLAPLLPAALLGFAFVWNARSTPVETPTPTFLGRRAIVFGIDGLRSGVALLFGERRDRRPQDRRRMRFGRIEIVVEIERMRDRPVDQRRPRRCEPAPFAKHGARAGAPWGNGVENLGRNGLERAGDHDRDRIDKLAMRPIQRVLGPAVTAIGDPRTINVKRVLAHSITLISS